VLCNRGANGTDGTVSSAFGAAAVADGPVVLLVGDVALAYDIGVTNLAGLRAALGAAMHSDATTIVRVASNRRANVAPHRELSGDRAT